MSSETWNFPTWQYGSGVDGDFFQASDFDDFLTESVTVAFSFFSGFWKTKTSGEVQYFTSIGSTNDENNFAITYVNDTQSYLRVYFKDLATGTVRYDFQVGDEDGSSYLQDNKWYQVVITADATSCLIAVNGTTSPFIIENTNEPGDINIDYTPGTDRWVFNYNAASVGTPVSTGQLPAFEPAVGPVMIDRRKIDITSTAALNRFYDDEGNFKNPGEDGSLWIVDTYGTGGPDIYWPQGAPTTDNGAADYAWFGGNSNDQYSAPGGLRKMYE